MEGELQVGLSARGPVSLREKFLVDSRAEQACGQAIARELGGMRVRKGDRHGIGGTVAKKRVISR